MEVKHNKIDPNKIKGVGLVFVRKEDPINLFVLSITKQLYSLIGFYYTTKVSGVERVNVVLSDVCGIVSSKWMASFTLKNLIYDPLVSLLSVRELCPVLDDKGCVDEAATKKRNGNFKAAIAKITSQGSENSVREWVKQLIGYEIGQPTSGSTTVELVNRVILETGNWDKIGQNGSMSVEGLVKNKTPDIIPKSSEGKNHIFTKLGQDFKQVEVNRPNVSNKLIQSYLVDNGVFGPLKHINLPKRNELEVNLRREQSISQHKSFLIEAVSVFVKMLLEDRKFFNVVVDGINHNTILANKIDEKFKSSVFSTLQSSEKVIGALVGLIEKGRVQYDDLRNIIEGYRSCVKNTLKVIDVDMNLLPSIESCKDKIIIFENQDCHKSKFDLNLKQLHAQVGSVVESINKNETPMMNINALISNLNCFIELSGSDLSKVKKVNTKESYGGVFTVVHCQKIPVQFKSGKRTIIPSIGYNLKQFNCGELRELLNAMDVIAKGNDDFDHLRSDVADKYSKCEKEDCKDH